jgi:hypothetical protein
MSQQREPLRLDRRDPRVRAHVRNLRGKSVRFLSKRYATARAMGHSTLD